MDPSDWDEHSHITEQMWRWNESTNVTLEDHFIELQEQFLYSLWFFVKCTLLTSLVLVTVAGNVLVIAAIVKRTKSGGHLPRLRLPMYRLVVNLAVADLLLGLFVLPISAAREILQGEWELKGPLCSFWTWADVFCCTASILSLCGISVDRFVGVSKPLLYSRLMSRRHTWTLIAIIWTLAIAISSAQLLLFNSVSSSVGCDVNKHVAYVLFSVCGSFYIPATVIIVLYGLVYRAAMKHTRFLMSGYRLADNDKLTLRVHIGPRYSVDTASLARLRSDSPVKSAGSSTCSLAEPAPRPRSRSSESVITSQHRQQIVQCNETGYKTMTVDSGRYLQVPSLEVLRPCKQKDAENPHQDKMFAKFQRQKKAAKTLAIVVGVFLVCWLPFFVILPIEAVCGLDCDMSTVFKISFWLGYFNSCLNPFIYACCSNELRAAFCHILRSRLRCRTKRSDLPRYQLPPSTGKPVASPSASLSY